jgi:hypothetical protein
MPLLRNSSWTAARTLWQASSFGSVIPARECRSNLSRAGRTVGETEHEMSRIIMSFILKLFALFVAALVTAVVVTLAITQGNSFVGGGRVGSDGITLKLESRPASPAHSQEVRP